MKNNKTTDDTKEVSVSLNQSLIVKKEENPNVRQSISTSAKPEEKKVEVKKKKYGLWDFTKFTVPYLWKGGLLIQVQTILTILMLLISRGLNVLHPLILKFAIDAITKDDQGIGEVDHGHTYMLVAMYAVVRFLADFVNNIREIPFANVSASSEIYIAHLVYNHIQHQSLAFHLSRETGKIIRIASRGSQSFSQILRYMLFNLTPIFIELIFVLIVIIVIYPIAFFFITGGSVVIYIATTGTLTEWRAKYFKKLATKDTEYNQKATDSLLNFETVKYFNAEDHEEERYLKALGEYKKENVSVAKSLVVLNIAQSFIIASGLVTALLVAYSKILDPEDNFHVGDFVMINTYILQMYSPLNFLGTFWRFIRQAMVDVEMVFELLEVDESIKDPKRPLPPSIKGGEIEFKNVSFTYDKKAPEEEKRMIINNLSFKVPAGKSVAIVGTTGSGKSTIVRLLYRFYDIEEGQILIDGVDVSQMKINDLRSMIAIVPQDCVLFNDTVMYNIGYGGVRDPAIKNLLDNKERGDELIQLIQPSAERAQIHQFIMQKAKGYKEVVGERGLKLSGGEKQRVAIARALLKKTPIMCFDEATSALDTNTEREIQKAIDEVSKGATTLMIAHRLSTVKNCDIIIVLKHGEIIEQGSHEQLINKEEGHYRGLWEKQSEESQRQIEEKLRKQMEEEEFKRALEGRKFAHRLSGDKKQRMPNPNNNNGNIHVENDIDEEESQSLMNNNINSSNKSSKQHRDTEVLDKEDESD